MEFKVLGPLEVTAAGRPVPIGNARKRLLVLAVLLARPGRPVPIDTLVEAVWGPRPPPSARRNLQLYVHQFRRMLGEEVIAGRRDGYAIDPGDGLDATRFRRLAAEGGKALDADDPATAETTLRAALDLWRGLAFAEFLDCELVAEEAQRLEQLRLEAYERWAEAMLVTGATPALVAELTELCRLHPYREVLRAHLMRALYQTGRQAEALAVFRETRALLVDQLGVEPSRSLQRLHEAMLRGEETPVPPPRVEARPVAVPRELPPAPAVFTGRAEALGLLDESLVGQARPVVICGMGGVGKTSLAVHWGNQIADRFPDGQMYVNLRGFAPGEPIRPIEALGLLLRSLGIPPGEVPVELDAAMGMYRTRLAGRRILVVLDNARDAEQVRPLLPAAPGCLALVTSRDRLTGLVARDGARRIALDTLTPAEAASLIIELLEGTDPDAAADLARACGYLPLAIRIAAAHLADRPDTIAEYIGALRANLDGLEVDGDPQASVRSAFAHSYDALDPPARRMFRLLGLVPGPDLTAPAAAALVDSDPNQARRVLDTLARAHLVNPGRPGRYALHDLLRAYAGELAHAADEAEQKDAAARLHDFYLSAVDAGARLLYPRAARPPIDVPDGFPHRTRFPDQAAATAWLDTELSNLAAVVERTAAEGPHRVAWLLACALDGYFWLRARYGPQWLATAEAGHAAATADGDRLALASTGLGMAVAHRAHGRPAEAVRYATDALTLSRQIGWRAGEAAAWNSVGSSHTELGDNQPALAAFGEALTVHRELAGPAGAAGPLSNLCGLRLRMGQLREALQDGLAALEIYQQVRDPSGEALAQFNTGACLVLLGEHDRAYHHLTRSIQLFESVGERYGQTFARCTLIKLHNDAGRLAEALEGGTATLRDAERTEHHPAVAWSLVSLVEARRGLGDHEHAVRDCARAVQRARRAHRRHAEANALIALAEAYRYDRQFDRALASVTAARRLTGRHGYQLLEGLALTVLAEIEHAAGDGVAAIGHAEAALAIHRQTGYRLGEERARTLLRQIR